MIIYEDILKEFQQRRVKYVLVGGMAFNLLGGLRNTYDLDILVDMTDGNLAKVVRILKGNGYLVKQPVDPIKIADKKTRNDWINRKHMKAFNFYKDDGLSEVDIIIESPVSYRNARKSAIVINAGKLILVVISIDDLIKMKKKAGRDIDIYDIKELKEIKKLQSKK